MVAKIEANIAEVQARLNAIKASGGDTSPALRAFGNVILNRIRMGFRLGRSPWGQSWRQLVLRDGQPLRNTGLLQRSITMQQVKDGVEIGTNLIQARVQHFGATIRPKNVKFLRFPGPNGFIFAKEVTIPARPFMPIDRSGGMAMPPQWAASGLEAMKKALQL